MKRSKYEIKNAASIFNCTRLVHTQGIHPSLYNKYKLCHYSTVLLLGAFAKLWKANISFVTSVCVSVRPSVRPHGTTRLPLEGVSLIANKNNGHFTWRHKHIYDNISLYSSRNEKIFLKICKGNQNNNYVFKFFSRKSYLLCGDMEKCGRTGQATYDAIIWSIRFACWVIQTTDTQSEYAIYVGFKGNNGYSNALHCYIASRLLLSSLKSSRA